MLALTGCWTVNSHSANIPATVSTYHSSLPNEQYDRDRIGHDIVNPTVMLRVNEAGGGTGVVIQETETGSRIITAAHVVKGAKTIRAQQTINGHTAYGFGLTILKIDDDLDLAILSCNVKWAGVARIINNASLLQNFIPAFTYGYPGSPEGQLDGILSFGFVSNISERNFAEGRTMTSSSVPVSKGNSGGGLFIFVDGYWQLAGVADYVLINRYMNNHQMVNTISAFVSASEMLGFIARSK